MLRHQGPQSIITLNAWSSASPHLYNVSRDHERLSLAGAELLLPAGHNDHNQDDDTCTSIRCFSFSKKPKRADVEQTAVGLIQHTAHTLKDRAPLLETAIAPVFPVFSGKSDGLAAVAFSPPSPRMVGVVWPVSLRHCCLFFGGCVILQTRARQLEQPPPQQKLVSARRVASPPLEASLVPATASPARHSEGLSPVFPCALPTTPFEIPRRVRGLRMDIGLPVWSGGHAEFHPSLGAPRAL